MDRYQKYLKRFEKNIDERIESLVTWIKTQFKTTKSSGVILGMSGGLDCSVVAVLCKKAGIPIQMLALPDGDSMSHGQLDDAMEISKQFDIPLDVYPIDDAVREIGILDAQYISNHNTNRDKNVDRALENIRPIIRMAVLSTIGQSINYVMVGTGNLTEISVGYFTKRGDGLSDFNPLAKYTKSEIRIIAKHIGIPEHIITKAPSADLKEGQTDEEDLGLRIEDIDRYLITGEGDSEITDRMADMFLKAMHKTAPIPSYHVKR